MPTRRSIDRCPGWRSSHANPDCFLTQKGLNMKIKIAAACFLAGALALPVAGYTADADSDRSSPKAFVKDAVITTKIKAKLAEEKLASAVQIKVDTDNKGVVTLSGTARTQEEADKAVSIARNVEGVAAVENNIKVASRY